EVVRLGGTRPVPIDVRIVAATHHDLKGRMNQGEFRADLYYRLNILRLHLPSLRAREQDLAPLALTLLDGMLSRLPSRLAAYDVLAPLLPQFLAYAWPGNVRELENVVERIASFVADCDVAESVDLDLI